MKSRATIHAIRTHLVASLLYHNKHISKMESVSRGIVKQSDTLKQFNANEATKHINVVLETGG